MDEEIIIKSSDCRKFAKYACTSTIFGIDNQDFVDACFSGEYRQCSNILQCIDSAMKECNYIGFNSCFDRKYNSCVKK